MRIKIVKDEEIKEIYDCFLAIWKWYNEYYDIDTNEKWQIALKKGELFSKNKSFPAVGKRLIPVLLFDISERIDDRRKKIPKKARSLIFSEFWYLYKRYYYPVYCKEWQELCLYEMNITSRFYKSDPLMNDLIKFILGEIDRKNIQRH